MKLTDVVNQLRVLLPKYTDRFSAQAVNIVSVEVAGGVATVTTDAAHGLVVGSSVTLSDVRFQNTIDSVSQSGLVFTFGTLVAHDLTENWQSEVELSGFTDAAWNGDLTLGRVPNRVSFTITSAEALPTLTGSELLLESRDDGVDGRYSVATVPTTTTFTVAGTFLAGDYSGGTLHTGVRVAGEVEFTRIFDEYTEQPRDDFWMFVVMHDVTTSKSREAQSDAVSTLPGGTDVRTRQLDGFSLYVFVNTSEQLGAVGAVDACRDELLGPIYKSIFGARFGSGLTSGGDFKAVPTASGAAAYQKAFYAHRYDFQVPYDVIDTDMVEPSNTHAFRDIDFTEEVGENELTVRVNLDEEPAP